MKHKPENVRNDAVAAFTWKAITKFDKGQLEHGGCLVERSSLPEMEDEIIDLWMYAFALRTKIRDIILRQDIPDELKDELWQMIRRPHETDNPAQRECDDS